MLRILFALLIVIIPFSAVHALDIQNVRTGTYPDKTRIVIESSDPLDYKAFTLSSPARLIVDLPLFVWQAGVISPAKGSGILNVRHAVNKPGISRIVFELDTKHKIKSSFILPPSGGGHRLVIDIAPGLDSEKTYGELDTQEVAANRSNSFILEPKSKRLRQPLIVIDPGHGGADPGAISPQNFFEKNIVLSLAKELKEDLEKTGRYRVRLTRSDDRFIRLHDRISFAREWGADMFISVHADSISRPNVRGASVYTLSNKASDAQTARLAERENRADIIAGVDLSHEDADVANILIDLAMRDTMNQSRFFANLIVDSFKEKNVQVLPNTHRYAGFAVLKAPDVPSVLIEAGFLSNKQEAAKLTDRAHRQRIVRAIRGGIDNYFTQLDVLG